MKIKTFVSVSALAAVLIGCGSGGDIEISADTIDNSVDNSTGGGSDDNDLCASYVAGGATVQGTFQNGNCVYDSGFVGVNNPMTTDLVIPFLAGGAHIFQDSLIIGENIDNGETSPDIGAPIPAAGEGPSLTIEAGVTLAFTNPGDFILINRGSQIFANGTSAAPITMTSLQDISGSANPGDVSQWAGVLINGNGITNRCTQAQRDAGTCARSTEGFDSQYGGSDNTENSGVLRFVVVKHSGFAVTEGNELNAITFNAVGSGTTVENVQVYSTSDDGLEFFGGAVNVKNYVALGVRDDSLDWSDGYIGKIQFALIKHDFNLGNRCIEGDNTGSSAVDDLEPFADPVVSNMTCITSGQTGTGPENSDSEGILLRRGSKGQIFNSVITTTGVDFGSNECLEIDGAVTENNANTDEILISNTVIACSETGKGNVSGTETVEQWFAAGTDNSILLAGGGSVGDVVALDVDGISTVPVRDADDNIIASAFVDDANTDITVTPADVTIIDPEFFEAVGFIGAVGADDNWTANWTIGLD